jgi:hypothetical protein
MPKNNYYLEQIAEHYTGEDMRGTDNQLLKRIADHLVEEGDAPPPPPGSTDWDDLINKPTTLAGFGITDAASDAELATHEGDTTNVHGIADTALLLTAAQINNSTLPGAFTTLSASGRADLAGGILVDGAFGGEGNWWSTNGLQIRLASYFSLGGDVKLLRDAANTFAQRNGTAAQTLRVYNTWTNESNYERLTISNGGATGGLISMENAGTGANRDIALRATQNVYIDGGNIMFRENAGFATRWTISSGGHFLAGTDNTYDIGASGATRPRSIYAGTNVTIGGDFVSTAAGGLFKTGATGVFYWNGRTEMRASADGNLLLNDTAGTSFGRLQFGGTTASFPALKRSGTILEARLADDSGFAPLTASILKSNSYTVATLPSASVSGAGSRVFVTDSSAALAGEIGQIVTGGGTDFVPVHSDGTNWIVG